MDSNDVERRLDGLDRELRSLIEDIRVLNGNRMREIEELEKDVSRLFEVLGQKADKPEQELQLQDFTITHHVRARNAAEALDLAETLDVPAVHGAEVCDRKIQAGHF